MNYLFWVLICLLFVGAVWAMIRLMKSSKRLYEKLDALLEKAKVAKTTEELQTVWEELKVVGDQCWHRHCTPRLVEIKTILQTKYQGKKNARTLAERLHDAQGVQEQVEDVILNAFQTYEPENYEQIEFSIRTDSYDNSIEIYIKNSMPYPYEPCWEIRNTILALGFGIVYWNFANDDGEFTDEIRGNEPRRLKNAPERSDAEWCKEFWDKWGISATDKRFDGTWFDKYQRK